jgi:hypothetical protein
MTMPTTAGPRRDGRLDELVALAGRLRDLLPPSPNVGPGAKGFSANWYGWCARDKLAGVIDLIAEAFERQEPWTLPASSADDAPTPEP